MNRRHQTTLSNGRMLIRAEMAQCVDTLINLVLEHGGNTQKTFLDAFQLAKQRLDSLSDDAEALTRSIEARMENHPRPQRSTSDSEAENA